jgi:hypothetical protein
MFLRGKAFDDQSPLNDLEEILLEATSRTEITWADRWVDAIRHQDMPTPPFSDLPLQTHRIPLLLKTLTDYLQLIELRLEPEDDAQIIFETLNALGEKLTPADLIRNFVFIQATRHDLPVDELYSRYWKQFDEEAAEPGVGGKNKLFWKVEERQGRLFTARLDALLYHYVSMRTGDEIKLDHVFEAFKQWWFGGHHALDAELGALKSASQLYHALVLPERTTRLGRFAHDVRVLDSSTAMPVVLLLGERLGTQNQEFSECLTILESYLVRRAICALPTKAYNRIFIGLVKRLSDPKTGARTETIAYLDGLSGDTQEWPTDDKFRRAWTADPTYRVLRPARTRMVLEALEHGLRNSVYHESPDLTSQLLHVEHVLPQAWQEHWPPPPAEDSGALLMRESMLHNIGNLTLLTHKLNPSLRNKAFAIKRPEITQSLLALNAYFQAAKWLAPSATWDEKAISARADELFGTALKIWPHPTSSDISSI